MEDGASLLDAAVDTGRVDTQQLSSLLACGDVDGLRLLLNPRSEHEQPHPPVGSTAGGAIHADPLRDTALTLADSLLERGCAKLQADARRSDGSRLKDTLQPSSPIELGELNIKLLPHPVMSETIWPAARALSRWLAERNREYCAGTKVLELGAGCGAPGIVSYVWGGAEFISLTDSDPDIISLMHSNCELNGIPGNRMEVGLLDWRDVDAVERWADRESHQSSGTGYRLVLAADVLFSVGDIDPIARAVDRLLAHDSSGARFVIARSAWFEDLQPTLVAHLEDVGLSLLSSTFDLNEGATILEFSIT